MRGTDGAYFSHDHAWWLPGAGHAEWKVEFLEEDRDLADPLAIDRGLDVAELERFAMRLENLSRDEIEEALSGLPEEWP